VKTGAGIQFLCDFYISLLSELNILCLVFFCKYYAPLELKSLDFIRIYKILGKISLSSGRISMMVVEILLICLTNSE